MPTNRRRHRRRSRVVALFLTLAVLGAAITVHLCKPPHPNPTSESPQPKTPDPATNTSPDGAPPEPFRLSDLTPPPDWTDLTIHQGTITREEFTRLLTTVFTVGEGWRERIEIGSRVAAIETTPGTRFLLRFAENGEIRSAPRHWHPATTLGPPPPGKPLTGLHIAIDPGHIGGPWARMEERWFSLNGAPPVTEGDLTLTVAKLLKPRLETLGAKVSLVRSSTDPVTPLRPDVIETSVQNADPATTATIPGAPGPNESPRLFAQRLFYRTAEIRARAAIVNSTLKPDLVLCLHFNAEDWGDPATPSLVSNNHFHLLLSGAFTDWEIAQPDQRFDMLRKLLQRTHDEEVSVCATVAGVFATATGLPPYRYDPNSPRARNVADNPFLWARNLLANRLYACPVVFLEPYVMNSPEVFARLQAGDFEGTRLINGVPRTSIFREYATAVADGLAAHYQKARAISPIR